MPEPTLDDLRAELRRRTDVVVPEAPTAAIMAKAASARRTRTRRALAGVAASVALVVGVGVAVAATTGKGDHANPSDKPSSEVPSKDPRTLEDLPVGEPSGFPFLMGRTVYQGGARYDLARRPSQLVSAGGAYPTVQYDDGSAEIVDVANRRTRQIAGPGSLDGPVVAGHNGQLTWTEGTSVVVVTPAFEGKIEKKVQAFPVHPACCDNPFQVYGITHYDQLVAGTPSDGAFTWTTRSDGLDPSTDPPVKLTGIGDASVYAVTPQEIVVMPMGGGGLEIGQADEGRGFVLNETVDAYQGYFDDGSMYVYSDEGGSTWVADRTRTYHGIGTGPSDVRPERRVRLRLPPDTLHEGVHGEADEDSGLTTHVVLDVPSEDGLEKGAQVRCDVDSGACEIAEWFDPAADIEPVGPMFGPGTGVSDGEVALVSRFVATARAAGTDRFDIEDLALDGTVQLGLGSTVYPVEREALADPRAWGLEPEDGYAGRTGVFSALSTINGYLATSSDLTLSNRPLAVNEDDPQGCGGMVPQRFPGTEGLKRLTIEPPATDSCLDWFAVDLYLYGEGTIAAVVLTLREP